MYNNHLSNYSEKKANIFNIKCLIAIAILNIIGLILNECNVFAIDKIVMRYATADLVSSCAIPLIIYLIHDRVKKKDTILEKRFFKWIIIIVSYFSIMNLCIVFGFHGILLLTIPPLMAVQYMDNKFLTIFTFVGSIILTIIVIYGAYLFGQYDANLLKPLTKEEADDIRNRINTLNSKRFFTVFLHYILPYVLCITAVDFIALSITKRNKDMLDIQIDLSNKVQDEILAKTHMQNGVIEHLADIIESRDLETGEHIKRTKKYVSILVDKMKDEPLYKDYLTPKMCENIINAAPLHDIGKIAVSDLILCKPGKLTDEEFEKMKIHTVKGGEIINNILSELGDKEFLNIAYQVAISHHEKWNGKGYPYGLKEEDIPLPGRIMAIADVFDALVAKRVYKDPMPLDKAIGIIIGDAGTHFDPNIVEVFKKVTDEFVKTATEEI